MPIQNLQDALVHEMRDVLSAEKQITKALRRMAKKASSEPLREAFELHLEQTEHQIERLEQAFDALGQKARAHRCEAMNSIIEEGKEAMEEVEASDVRDAMLIATAQKVEHYEICAYGTLCTWAEQLGLEKAKQLLAETLEEEKQTDEKLTKIATQLNQQAIPAGQQAVPAR